MKESPQFSPESLEKIISTKEISSVEAERKEITQLIEMLTQKFQTGGGNLGEFLSAGSPEQQSTAHSFLFSEAVEEMDSVKRRLLTLAHLEMEQQIHKATEIKSPYGNRLTKSGRPAKEAYPGYFYFDGMLASGQEINKGMQGQKLRTETEKLTDVFLKFSENFRVMREKLREKHGEDLIKGIKQEQMATILATQQTLVEFFGFFDEHSASRNLAKYKEGKANLEDFRSNRNAVCTEYALLAQQLIAFSGLETKFISGGPLMIGNEQGEFELPNFEGHVYNLVSIRDVTGTETMFLFDPSNPILIKSETDPTAMQVKSFFVPISDQQWQELRSGKNMFVEYDNTHRAYSIVS